MKHQRQQRQTPDECLEGIWSIHAFDEDGMAIPIIHERLEGLEEEDEED